MNRTRALVFLSLVSLAAVGGDPVWAGPAGVDDGELAARADRLGRLDRAVRAADVRDASLRVFDSRPWARAEVRSLARLRAARSDQAYAAKVERVRAFLGTAAGDGRTAFELELARELGCGERPARPCLAAFYRDDARVLLEAELAAVERLPDAAAVDAWLAALDNDLRPSIKTRGRIKRQALTAPAFPFVYAWRKRHSAQEYEGPQPIDFPHARVYRPEGTRAANGPRDAELLARWAPVLVQEVDPAPDYPERDDHFGALHLEREGGDVVAAVDVSRPASYAYVDRLPIRHGTELTQLVYTFWYPEHPKLKKPIDVEHGDVEGITLRLTLDPAGVPRLFETVYNCGCSHRLFVDRRLEAAAAAEYGAPEEGRPYSVQRHLDGKIDWIVPELVDVVPGERPWLFVRSAFHLPAAVRFAPPSSLEAAVTGEESYEVVAYEELERMPFEGRPLGVFDDTGLVRGAHRLEGLVLMPLGLYHAGHPRQRRTQLIHFDQADFDDPGIYERYLRLPDDFWRPAPTGGTHTATAAREESAGGER